MNSNNERKSDGELIVAIKRGQTEEFEQLFLRYLPLTKKLSNMYYFKYLEEEDYLFPSTKGGHVEVNTVYQMFQKGAKLLGRDDIGTHTLRKTFGYHYYKKTKDVATLMEIFGHSSEKITKRYIGINEDEISETLLNFRLGF